MPSGPRPDGLGHDRTPSQSLSGQTGSCQNPIVMPINDPTDPWLDQASNCWPRFFYDVCQGSDPVRRAAEVAPKRLLGSLVVEERK